MNTYLLFLFLKIANKLNCKGLVRSILLYIRLPYRKYFSSVEDAEDYVNSKYPDVDNSCVCHNTVMRPPLYDLQIVIPVYNVEPYIGPCIQSVLEQQTQYTFIVNVVNDGSTDGSRKILENYANDERIRIIDQDNKGIGGARNTAIKNIEAKYLMFIDSDDLLAEGAIENLMQVAIKEDADIVEGSYVSFSRKKRRVVKHKTGVLPPSDFRGFPWGKVIKADLFENIQFPLNYWYEDTLMGLVVFRLSKKSIGIEDVVYYYRTNPNSMTHKANRQYKNIDSFYVTRRLLKDRKMLNIGMTEELFQTLFEKQIPINTSRIASVPDAKLNYAHFILTCALVENLCEQKEFVFNSEKANNIFRAVKERDYSRFIVYCLFSE